MQAEVVPVDTPMQDRAHSPLVSVVIATYNMGQHLPHAITSVLEQTYRNLELHIVDDGSTDNTREVVARFNADPRLNYIRQSNAGQTVAKNRGIAESRGELIAFCDADDLWKPDKLTLQVPLFAARASVGLVYSNVCVLLPDGTIVPNEQAIERPSGVVLDALFKYNFVPFGTAIVRRSCIEELGSFDVSLRMSIDWEMWLRVATRYEFVYLDEVTYVYRVWEGQMSRNWRGRYLHCLRIMDEFLQKHPDSLSPGVARDAYVHTFVERARVRSTSAGEHLRAFADIARALRRRPDYLPAWKLIARVGLNMIGVRDRRPRVA